MKWVTREKVHVDRVACPWLIKRFIDKDAEFVFVPRDTDPATITDGTPYDMKGVELGHHGDECSFDAIMKKYDLGGDRALSEVQRVVRGADTGNFAISPISETWEKIAVGFGLSCAGDFDNLDKQFPMYDALYAYFKQQVNQ